LEFGEMGHLYVVGEMMGSYNKETNILKNKVMEKIPHKI
jgi:hypothetical protein